MPVPYHEPSTEPPPSSPPSSSNWGPYSGAGDFSANMVILLIILFCALVLALALNAVIRYLLCAARRRRPLTSADPEKQSIQKMPPPPVEAVPTLIFSAGTKLAGTEADCAICLLEFADGDRVRVLPACNHGFHVSCIEQWLGNRKSCPTCRSSCHVEVGPVGKSVVDGV